MVSISPSIFVFHKLDVFLKIGYRSSDVSCQLGDSNILLYDFLSPICFYYVFVYTAKSCVFHGANDKLMAFWEVQGQC